MSRTHSVWSVNQTHLSYLSLLSINLFNPNFQQPINFKYSQMSKIRNKNNYIISITQSQIDYIQQAAQPSNNKYKFKND